MIKSLALVALLTTSFAASALAGSDRHHRVPANATSYYGYVDARPADPAPAPVAAATAPREDFGSFSAGNVARNFGY